MEWWWVYLAIGVTVGFLAGLFGIGGGMIMVPMLVFVFTAKGFQNHYSSHQIFFHRLLFGCNIR